MKRPFNARPKTAGPNPPPRQPTDFTPAIVRISSLYQNDDRHNGTHSRRLPLPDYDAPTKRVESGAFILLGLIGFTLIALAGRNAIQFSENREAIAAALSLPPSSLVASTNHTFTNLTAAPATADRIGPRAGRSS